MEEDQWVIPAEKRLLALRGKQTVGEEDSCWTTFAILFAIPNTSCFS
jgi:hypothetical protein